MRASDDDQPQQVVTWHVIVWILLTLAISSMSQPGGTVCGRPRRQRVYLCFSPLVCTADALSIPVQVLLARKYYPKMSLSNTLRYVVYNRFRRRDAERKGTGCNETMEWPDSSASWPRWIFFIVGTLPAFIKLISFSGVPWSQAWGLMFALSYLTIEALLTSVVRFEHRTPPSSIEEALGYSPARLQLDVNQQLHDKINHFRRVVDISDFILLTLAYIGQFLVASWALLALCRSINDSELSLSVGFYIVYALVLTTLNLLMFGHYLWMCFVKFLSFIGGHSRLPPRAVSVKTERWMWLGVVVLATTRTVLHVDAELTTIRFQTQSIMSQWAILCLILFLMWVLQNLLSGLFRRYPRVHKLLLASSYGQVEDVTIDEKALIDEDALCVVSFCASLSIAVMWYGIGYDPVGTTNPAWTDVFG